MSDFNGEPKPLSVLHVWPYYNEELKYHVNYLCDELAKRGFKVELWAANCTKRIWLRYVDADSLTAGERECSFGQLLRIRSIHIVRKCIPIGFVRMFLAARRAQPDIVHLFGISSFFNAVCLFWLCVFCRKKFAVVINDHSNPHLDRDSTFSRLYFKFFKILFSLVKKKTHCIYVPNKATANLLSRRYGFADEYLRIVPLGFDNEVFTTDESSRNRTETFQIVFAGKVNRAKQLERLFAAMESAGLCESAELKVAGVDSEDDYTQSLIALAETHNVRTEFLPLLNPTELADLYAKADLAVFPGSISITTLEANGCGLPVIVYESIEGLQDRVSDGRGELFSTDDELVSALKKYHQQKATQGIDHVSIKTMSMKYSWENIAKIYGEDYLAIQKHGHVSKEGGGSIS